MFDKVTIEKNTQAIPLCCDKGFELSSNGKKKIFTQRESGNLSLDWHCAQLEMDYQRWAGAGIHLNIGTFQG